jgi:hypothetical protein
MGAAGVLAGIDKSVPQGRVHTFSLSIHFILANLMKDSTCLILFILSRIGFLACFSVLLPA